MTLHTFNPSDFNGKCPYCGRPFFARYVMTGGLPGEPTCICNSTIVFDVVTSPFAEFAKFTDDDTVQRWIDDALNADSDAAQ